MKKGLVLLLIVLLATAAETRFWGEVWNKLEQAFDRDLAAFNRSLQVGL